MINLPLIFRFRHDSLLLIGLILFSCDKNTSGSGSLLIQVTHNHYPLDVGSVYLSGEPRANLDIGSSGFIDAKPVDAVGEVYFPSLPPGDYFIYVRSRDPVSHAMLTGKDSAQIGLKFRSNIQRIVIETN